MINLDQYFGIWADSPDATPERKQNAGILLPKVNLLLIRAASEKVPLPINPRTHTQISGNTFGGFRPQECPQGAPGSSHKEGMAVDVFDLSNAIDDWITRYNINGGEDNTILREFDLFREHPTTTLTWCHLTTRPPRSKHRTFFP